MELMHGINFGGYLSQCVHTKEHYGSFISRADVEQVKAWGFDHIRLPFDYNLLEDADGAPQEGGWGYLDAMVDWCGQTGLGIILDLHKAAGYDFNDAGAAGKNNLFQHEELQRRFLALWANVSARYAAREHVAFELLNEVVEEENADGWNALIDRAVQEIRAHAPERTIIYGGIRWNSAATVRLLKKPRDKNIMFTFHFYEPIVFTHQKAPWVPDMPADKTISYPESMDYYRAVSAPLGHKGQDVVESRCATMGVEYIESMVQTAVRAAQAAGVPLYCGEYGVIDRAPADDSLRWFEDVAAVFRKFSIGGAAWTYKRMDFGICDAHYDPIRARLLALLTGKQ